MEPGSDSQTKEERLRSKDGQQTEQERGSDSSQNESFVRDRALKGANNEHTGEKIRPDPYEAKKESLGVASKRDVSPNTPKGEQL